ncbi:preprotein translocase subunit SecG [Arcanobacterium wilhelmae]|uniref:Preprotein translocase subunit SecG n=1 Tax=Arcanobacterium wilhelmae TaxID=1803177 RepID=A0ABT9N948_9ACTO|nr:hypothetical protein [Arcanobacterium wilhelmae]MDP9800218.1 preprotein translocase subunit SecG [Arcanobacterium wilhelmae]
MSEQPTEPKNLRERYRAAKANLSEEDAAKFKKQQRIIFASAAVFGVIVLVLGYFAGKAAQERKSEPSSSPIVYSQYWEES